MRFIASLITTALIAFALYQMSRPVSQTCTSYVNPYTSIATGTCY